MDRRTFERIPTSLNARYLCRETYYITIKDCSENGLSFISSNFIHHNDDVEIHLPLKKEVLNINAKIRRTYKIDDYNYIIGVEIVAPPRSYLEFINTLRSVYESLNYSFIPHLYQ